MDFSNVAFCGKFRDYQQRIIDNSHKYLADGKINIVAAPGSGKTVLGLELIRRLNSPCIILSPTTAIRQQWGERFREMFLRDENDFEKLFSKDLHHIRLLNSVTYQALYTAIEKVSEDSEEEPDCSDVNIFSEMKKFGIKTVCLDEAHHLKNEWQRALEKFISQLDKDVKIISLTATPPYDSEGNEWARYEAVCGEIDEEIFVPELVGQNTLCPHQDYIFFNFPSQTELEHLKEYKENAFNAVEEIGGLEAISKLCKKLNDTTDYDVLFENTREFVALMVLFSHYGFEVKKRLVRELTVGKALPRFTAGYGEIALQFLVDSDFSDEIQKEEIVGILKKHGVYHKKKVCLELNEKLKRSLISSVGKLESIKKIAKSEISALGEDLRMLVLCDYIKKEELARITACEQFSSVNVVSIFESLRRENPDVAIGVLSGTLVILPDFIDLSDIKHKRQNIEGTNYSVVEIPGASHKAVDYVQRLFEKGGIKILVGTKSLLGEGWDSPCINSLILASFVGSFVLSNQMRGRAIRIDRNNPQKASAIWHLATVEPDYLFEQNKASQLAQRVTYNEKVLVSADFELLRRRFDAFLAPDYTTGGICSGIERITPIKPPFDKAGIEKINDKMLELSGNRDEIREKWHGEVSGGKFNVCVETEIPKEKRIPPFAFLNFGLLAVVAMIGTIVANSVLAPVIRSGGVFGATDIIFLVAVGVALFAVLRKFIIHINPARSFRALGKAVYKTLCQCKIIDSSARLMTYADESHSYVSVQLKNATIHDQNIFNTAMTEMLSMVENPRYVIIKKNFFGGFNYRISFACPSVIGRKKEYVDILSHNLKSSCGKFETVYTRKENGRKIILLCRRNSYITKNEREKCRMLQRKFRVSRYE